MFQHLKNIDTAFKHVRLFTAVLTIAFALTNCYTLYWSYRYAETKDRRLYVIINGKALEAVAGERKDNITVEARDHIKVFHQLFFRLTPDEKAIEDNVKQSLYLADRSAKQAYDNLKENGFYNQVVSANISQEVACDSITVNISQHPYYFRFYGKERIERPTATTVRTLVTEGYLRDLGERTDNNPHGFLIERWTTLQNTDIGTTKK